MASSHIEKQISFGIVEYESAGVEINKAENGWYYSNTINISNILPPNATIISVGFQNFSNGVIVVPIGTKGLVFMCYKSMKLPSSRTIFVRYYY